jgi:hypothetical protein
MKHNSLFGIARVRIDEDKEDSPIRRQGKTLSLMRSKRKYDGKNRSLIPGRRVRGIRKSSRVTAQHTRVFRCHLESCGKTFGDRASLKKHMTVHGDKLVSF